MSRDLVVDRNVPGCWINEEPKRWRSIDGLAEFALLVCRCCYQTVIAELCG